MAVEFERKSRKKRRWGRTVEYSSYERKFLFGSSYKEEYEKIKKGLGKFKTGVTPQELAQTSDIRVSVAKQILTDLEQEGLMTLALKSKRVKFFLPTKK
jgi:ribosomal protein S25